MRSQWIISAVVAMLFLATNAKAQSVREIDNPAWTAQPSAKQTSAVYPFNAMANEKIGVAVVRCAAAADGRVNKCGLVCETPLKWQFGAAAKKLTRYYLMETTLPDGRSVDGGTVTLPFFFNPSFLERLPRCDGAKD